MAKEAGPGFPTIIEEKPVGYHDKPCSIWQRLPYRSDTGGVSPMWLEGREFFMNERMRGMTPDRRAWRKQFLADQVLSHREPVFVPEMYYQLVNPFRRAWRYPWETLIQGTLTPYIGEFPAKEVKRGLKWLFIVTCTTYAITYWVLFHEGTWLTQRQARLQRNKPVVYPGDPDYPFTSDRTEGEDYVDFGFKKSVFYKSADRIRAEHAEDLKKGLPQRP